MIRRFSRRFAIEGRRNEADYREIAIWGGIPGGILWPVYGLFCSHYLGLPERMGTRVLLCVAYVGFSVLARVGRFGIAARWLWVVCGVVGMIWLPWVLYLDSDRAPYWIASLSFFGTVLGLTIRSWDLPIAVAGGVLLALATGHRAETPLDVGMMAVALISTFFGVLTIWILRSSRRRIEIQNRRIRSQNDRLLVLDRAKDEFTAGIAHDLRTPLTVAVSLADDLGREDLTSTARKRLGSLVMALDQMRRQSEDLLDLERFQLGVAKLDPAQLDVAAWVGRFEEGLTSLARTRGISFQVVHHSTDLLARFDAVRMEAVLHNLVSNAFKFTPEGGHVEVHLGRHEERTLVLTVIDDGEGIPAQALPAIFERYQQVDRGPGTYTVGAGIGLALVKEIVEAHGGTIRVESTPTLGSLFEVKLPDALLHPSGPGEEAISVEIEAPPRAVARPATPRPDMRGALLALIVEDDTLMRHILSDLLSGVARCATARDGREGLRLAHELHPDIVISDIAMPHMDGMELLAALRQDPVLAQTPVVLLSGDPVTLQRRLAFDALLSIQGKPFDREKLVEAILDLTASGG